MGIIISNFFILNNRKLSFTRQPLYSSFHFQKPTHKTVRSAMAVTDLFAGEIATELLKTLVSISLKSCGCKASAEQLIKYIEQFIPIIQEIKYSGVELPAERQFQLDRFSETLRYGQELCQKVLNSNRWNFYRNLQLARKMEKLEKTVSRFIKGPLQANLLADIHHIRFETAERFDRLEGYNRRLEQRLGELKIGVGGGYGGGWMEEALKRAEEEDLMKRELGCLVRLGLDSGKKQVKEMVIEREDLRVVGICGIGGSGKTTLAREFCRDEQVRSYFGDRILFLTVSQSPNVDQLKAKIWGFIMGNENLSPISVIPQYMPPLDWKVRTRTLVVLDDVWSLQVLERLITPGCKILVVSRSKFPTVLNATYEVELLRDDEALSLFCHSAFGQKSMPPTANENLVKQIVNECKGLPLALKVIGASLRDQTEMFWASAKNRLSRGEPICESHENNLLERMATSVNCLPKKVRECFLDLGAFPEDKKIPLDVLINMWVEIHDIEEDDAFAIVVELSNKNLVTLVKDARDGDIYSSYYDISVTQHDVLRDLALHLSNCGNINERRRLLMPRRESCLPKEWERNSDEPFNAQIVSIHTGEMNDMDWLDMRFPKAEVLILNFASSKFFLPHFMNNMPKLRALIVINYGSKNSTLYNSEVFSSLVKLRSLWLEKVFVPQLSNATVPLKYLRKLSLVLCRINNSLDRSVVNLPYTLPSLLELTIDHCVDLCELPSSICGMHSLKNLSITNCHGLRHLPADLGKLKSLQILRLYACPSLKSLPSGICELVWLEYLDISQCVNLSCLPMEIGKMASLKKINMRECSEMRNLSKSAVSLKSLRHVICDEEISCLWKDVEAALPDLHVQVAENYFTLDWLDE